MGGIEDRFRVYLLSSGKTKQSADSYVCNVRVFRKWATDHEVAPDIPDVDVARAYIATESERLQPNTLALRRSCLRAFYIFLGTDSNFLKDVTAKRTKMAPRRPFSQAEIDAVLAGCRNKRDKDMITIAYRTAMRVSEVVNLRAWDVDLANGLILVHGKGRKERWVVADDIVKTLIAPYLQHSSGILWWTKDATPLTLRRAKRNMSELAKRTGVKAHWHRIRNTFASEFLRETHDIDALQTIMGHEDSSTTRRYAAWEEQDRALDQMRKFSATRSHAP